MYVEKSLLLVERCLHAEHARLLGRPAWAIYSGDCFDVSAMSMTWLFGISIDSDKGAESLAAARAWLKI